MINQFSNKQILHQMGNLENSNDLYSMKEAIEYTGLSRSTLDRARRTGELKAFKKRDNWKVHFYKEDLDQFTQELTPEKQEI